MPSIWHLALAALTSYVLCPSSGGILTDTLSATLIHARSFATAVKPTSGEVVYTYPIRTISGLAPEATIQPVERQDLSILPIEEETYSILPIDVETYSVPPVDLPEPMPVPGEKRVDDEDTFSILPIDIPEPKTAFNCIRAPCVPPEKRRPEPTGVFTLPVEQS